MFDSPKWKLIAFIVMCFVAFGFFKVADILFTKAEQEHRVIKVREMYLKQFPNTSR